MHPTNFFRSAVNQPFVSWFAAICLLTITGCQQYGEVSPKAHQISTALYSVCNRQDQDRLKSIETLIDTSSSDQTITPSEKAWLSEIVETARGGDWISAAQDARTMMEEQIQKS